jgi:pyruvate kinase
MRRAKIVCTLGPATDTYDQIKALVDAGMDVARFNLSHGTYAEHEVRYRRVRKAADETGRNPRRPSGPEDPARSFQRRTRTP